MCQIYWGWSSKWLFAANISSLDAIKIEITLQALVYLASDRAVSL